MRVGQCCTARPARRKAVSGARRRQSRRRSGKREEADARTRTGDPFITSEVLYQLSYVGLDQLSRIHGSDPGAQRRFVIGGLQSIGRSGSRQNALSTGSVRWTFCRVGCSEHSRRRPSWPPLGPRHHRPDPRLLGDAAELGGLDHPLRAARLPRPRARLPRLRGRGRGAQRRPDADRGADGAGDHRAPRVASSAALDSPPILMGHSAGGVFTQILLDHGFGAAGVGDQLGADRGRQAWCRCRRSGRRSRC